MKFLDCAPVILIEEFETQARREPPFSPTASGALEMFAIEFEHEGCFESDDRETLRAALASYLPGKLPDEEARDLLGRLISALAMQDVWPALTKCFGDPREAFCFVRACEAGISGWRRDWKKSPAERRARFAAIRDAAHHLAGLMADSPDFRHYSIDSLIDEQKFLDYLVELYAAHDVDLGLETSSRSPARYYLGEVIPSVSAVLTGIADRADALADERPVAKKPNAVNAEVHYFVRHLSSYLRRHYGRPMHGVVTTTASVIFDLPDLDYEAVKKNAAAPD